MFDFTYAVIPVANPHPPEIVMQLLAKDDSEKSDHPNDSDHPNNSDHPNDSDYPNNSDHSINKNQVIGPRSQVTDGRSHTGSHVISHR